LWPLQEFNVCLGKYMQPAHPPSQRGALLKLLRNTMLYGAVQMTTAFMGYVRIASALGIYEAPSIMSLGYQRRHINSNRGWYTSRPRPRPRGGWKYSMPRNN
jgi:hypothetical protein